MRRTPPRSVGAFASSCSARFKPHDVHVPPPSRIARIAARALRLSTSLAASMPATTSTPDENPTIAKLSSGCRWSTSRIAAACASASGCPLIEPEWSINTTTESGGRTWPPACAAWTSTTMSSSCAALAMLDASSRASIVTPSSEAASALLGPRSRQLDGSGADPELRMAAAITVAPAAAIARDVQRDER